MDSGVRTTTADAIGKDFGGHQIRCDALRAIGSNGPRGPFDMETPRGRDRGKEGGAAEPHPPS